MMTTATVAVVARQPIPNTTTPTTTNNKYGSIPSYRSIQPIQTNEPTGNDDDDDNDDTNIDRRWHRNERLNRFHSSRNSSISSSGISMMICSGGGGGGEDRTTNNKNDTDYLMQQQQQQQDNFDGHHHLLLPISLNEDNTDGHQQYESNNNIHHHHCHRHDHDYHHSLPLSPQPSTQQQQQPQPLSILAAALALMKGNLGPGILNLPHAFSKIRTAIRMTIMTMILVSTTTTNTATTNNNDRYTDASTTWMQQQQQLLQDDDNHHNTTTMIITGLLFAMVTIQGLYSMALLVHCKNILNQYYYHSNLNANVNANRNATTVSAVFPPLALLQRRPPSPPQQQQQQSSPGRAATATQQQQRLVLQQPSGNSSSGIPTVTTTPPHVVTINTFMDVTKVTFGTIGERCTEVLIVIVQIGVCCVFISLINTNIQVVLVNGNNQWLQQLITPATSLLIITILFVITVTIFRYIHDLFCFNAIANTFMLTAIVTVTITSIMVIVQQQQANDNNDVFSSSAAQQQRYEAESTANSSSSLSVPTTTAGAILYLLQASITFIADLFFAFEGIGLVLPVENNYNNQNNNNNSNNNTTSNNHTVVHGSNNRPNPPPPQQPLHQRSNLNISNNYYDQIATGRVVTTQHQRTNSGNSYDDGDGDDDYPHDHSSQVQQQWTFSSVLLISMGSVAILFAIIGFISSIAFRNHLNGDDTTGTGIQNASITAFLQETYPNVVWYSIINCMVVMAVAMTFPLQLTPAMEVLEKWLSEWNTRCPSVRSCGVRQLLRTKYSYYYHPRFFRTTATAISRIDSDEGMIMQTVDHHTTDGGNVILNNTTNSPRRTVNTDARYTTPPDIDSTFEHQQYNALQSPARPSPLPVSSSSFWTRHGWMIRRWIVVVSCSTIVLVVNDLGLLVSLFGAVGQTGLAAMPCAVHLALQYKSPYIAPKSIVLTIADVLVLIFCSVVMVAGCCLSIRDIVNKTS